GFVDVDNKGLDGIEYRFDKLLSGREKGGIFDTDKELITGTSISLTIDRFIQYFSEKEIEKAVVKFRAKRGIAMVLEVKTGKLLAVANYPDFDPNYYWRYSDEERRNSAIVYSFEPGSTLKMIAVAHILESVPNILKRKLFCNGKIKIADTSLKCTGRHGSVDLYDIIKYSCNVGIIQAMNEVRKDKFYKTLREFGFGEKVGIQFPGESRGILRPLIEWSGLSKYSISIGQEISVSPLQLIAAIGAIANQGVYIIPSIVESIYREDGSIVQSFYLKTRGQIIRGDTARTIIRLMRGVVIGGTGKHASLEYYNAVGKTGTAQKSKGRGGYYQDKVNVSFIGIAPYENPDICVLVMIDEPQLGNSGGEIAAPVFASIAHRVLLYRRVKLKRIIAKDPIVREYRTRKFNGTTMPNFKGLLMSESIQMLVAIQKTANIKYSFIGTGKVYKQLPIYGKAISKGQQIILYLR
ncbi:MAG: penicillin-binding transpeptidase domain-containing protein, partial [Spirochaetota bacterium]|nr:penicillin-binding transpeptidase domain-containing protein [Spirochaetota bacterium]